MSARERDCPPRTGDEEPRHPRTMGPSPLPVMLAEPTGPVFVRRVVPLRFLVHQGRLAEAFRGVVEPAPWVAEGELPVRKEGVQVIAAGSKPRATPSRWSIDTTALPSRPPLNTWICLISEACNSFPGTITPRGYPSKSGNT